MNLDEMLKQFESSKLTRMDFLYGENRMIIIYRVGNMIRMDIKIYGD